MGYILLIWIVMGLFSGFMWKTEDIGFLGKLCFFILIILGPIGLVLQLLAKRTSNG